MKRIAIIASGGDAAGINSAILPLIQQNNFAVVAFHGGYDGIVQQDAFILRPEQVREGVASNRNVLRSARSQLPWQVEGRQQIRQRLHSLGIDLLVVFGGGGSLQAANLLNEEGLPTLLIPMTIDNDIGYTDYTLGFGSAVSVVTQALDQLHGTAHNMPGRIYVLEAFGAESGHIALSGALAGAAHAVILPEQPVDWLWLHARLQACMAGPFGYGIVVCAEGSAAGKAVVGSQGGSLALGQQLAAALDVPVRHTLPGYCQRAAIPVAEDRLAAVAFGQRALQAIREETLGLAIGMDRGNAIGVQLREIAKEKRQLDPHLVVAARNLQMIN